MVNKLQRKSEGFTIIEVLIVLAIAGLIMLIVFLAVPALQRNSRNTSYRNEASQLLSAATEFSNNNNGSVPGTVGTASADAAAIIGLTNNKNITNLTIQGAGGTTAAAFDTAVLRTGARCGTPGTGGAYSTTAGSTRSLALIYAIEDSSGNPVGQCQES